MPDNPRLLALLAASEGAKPEWQEQALKLPVAALDSPSQIIVLAALATRLKKPHRPYLDRDSELMERRDEGKIRTVVDYISQMIHQAPKPSLESEMSGLSPDEHGLVFAAAVIIHPWDAPPHWRKAVKRLLFAIERPYFAVD